MALLVRGPGTAETGSDLPCYPTPRHRGMPAHRVPLGESDHAVERSPRARDDDRGPRRGVPGEVDRAQDDRPRAPQGPSEIFADHRADHRKDARHLRGGEHVWERGRNPDASEGTVALGRRIATASARATGVDGREAAQRVDEHREEAQDCGDRDLRRGLRAEPDVVIGANAMIGMAFAAIRYGIKALPNGRQRARTSAVTIAKPLPRTNPPTASFNVIHAPRRSRSRSSMRARTTSENLGSRKSSTPSTSGKSHCQATSRQAEDDDCRHPVAHLLTEAPGSSGRPSHRAHAISSSVASVSSTSSAPVAWSDSRTWVTSSKNRGSSRVSSSAVAAGRSGRPTRSGPAAAT